MVSDRLLEDTRASWWPHMWRLSLNNLISPPQTLVCSCCWRACHARALCFSWVCWRPALPACTPSAPPAAMPAPAAVQPSRRRPWRNSAATPIATRCCSSLAVSPSNVSSFVWTAARSAIAARGPQEDKARGLINVKGLQEETLKPVRDWNTGATMTWLWHIISLTLLSVFKIHAKLNNMATNLMSNWAWL